MTRPPANRAASVRQRLLNLARAQGQVFDVVLVAFGLERLLYRLSLSSYRDRFVLKGGLLVTLWTADTGRFTRDIDFLAFGPDDEASLRSAFAEILAIDAEDGLVFDAANLTAMLIREDQVYGGMRLRTTAHLGATRISVTIDLGFGDALGDPQYQVAYGSLLDFPPAMIRAYSPATVIAEKFHAVVALGLANSRMKDFYDLVTLPRAIPIETDDLAKTIQNTFERRTTAVPQLRPDGLSDAFGRDPIRQTQWRAYVADTELADSELIAILEDIWSRLGPICTVIAVAAEASDNTEPGQ